MKDIPVGTVTFLFSDIEGSTYHAQTYPDSLPGALKKHNKILTEAIESNNGFIFLTAGDAFCSAFKNASDAVNAAYISQINLAACEWADAKIKVRIGIHSGNAEWVDDKYLGYVTLAKTQRVMSVAHGGQILATENTVELTKDKPAEDIYFRDLGDRKLKDLIQPVKIYQVSAANLESDFPPIKSVDIRPNNLPSHTTNFIGREKEIKEIKEIIRVSRLVTLIGAGGTGKSRISLQTAYELIDEYENGVWFAELAHLSDPEFIISEISSSVNFKSEGALDTEEALINFLKDKKLLIILDNCEHLIYECAQIIEKFLSNCPGIKIIASSRELMKVKGEISFNVPVLNLPQYNKTYTADSVLQFESVRLFADRASLVKPDFKITDENAQTVAEICYRLDGIPLALELAAARLKVLNVEKIKEKINDRFRLLTTGSRTVLPRQQTLRALIDWSYDLLDEKEKLLFQRLTVFSRGWTLEAAEEICSDDKLSEDEILELISNLSDKSLISANNTENGVRYSMLETIRHYGMEKLESENIFLKKHFDYYLKLCGSKENAKGKEQIKIYKEIFAEQDNLRSSIHRAIESDPQMALKLANEIGDIWEFNGNIKEGYDIYKKIFNTDSDFDVKLKADAYLHISFLSSQLGKYDEAEKYLKECLTIFRVLNFNQKTGDCLNNLGNLYFLKDDMEAAERYHYEALNLGKEIKDDFLIGISTVNIASVNSYHGNPKIAIEQYEEGLKIFREIDDILSASRIMVQLGREEMKAGNPEKSRMYYEESIPVLKELNDHIPIIVSLLNLGILSESKENFEETQSLFEEALSIAGENGYTHLQIHSYKKLGDFNFNLKNYGTALGYYSSGLSLCNPDMDKNRISQILVKLISFFLIKGNFEKSALLAGTVKGISDSLKIQSETEVSEKQKAELKTLCENLGKNSFDYFFEKGKSIPLEDVIKLVKEDNEV